MKITEVRIKLMEDQSERLKAFCSITFDDCFVIRDLKIIDGTNGPFVAMPSRKLTSHCSVCRYKNHIRAAFCNQCGTHLKEQMPARDEDGRAKLYADIAHPINSACREMIQREVISAFEEEKIRAQAPGYISRYDDYDMDIDSLEVETRISASIRPNPVGERMESEANHTNHSSPRMEHAASGPGSIHSVESYEKPRGPHHVGGGFSRERVPETSGGFGTGIFDD